LVWEEAKLAGSFPAMNPLFVVGLATVHGPGRGTVGVCGSDGQAAARPGLLEQWAYYSWERQFLCQISLCRRVYSVALQGFRFAGSFFTCSLRLGKEATGLQWKMSVQLIWLVLPGWSSAALRRPACMKATSWHPAPV